MAKRVSFYRASATVMSTLVGKIGELIINTTRNSIHVHDGVTVGGVEVARSDLTNVLDATSSVAGKMTAAQVATLESIANYMPLAGGVFTGTVVNKLGADIASASALPVNISGNIFDVTGTVAITSIASKGIGAVIILEFDAALVLTHHATNLVLPGGLNITTAAGDIGVFVEYATGKWRCVSYTVATPSMFYGQNTTTQSVAGFSFIKVNYPTEVYDYGADFASSVFTARVAGEYDFSATLWTSTSNWLAGEVLNIHMMKNGLAGTIITSSTSMVEVNNSLMDMLGISVFGVPLAAGDTIQIACEHSHAAGNITVNGNISSSGLPMVFSGRKVQRW